LVGGTGGPVDGRVEDPGPAPGMNVGSALGGKGNRAGFKNPGGRGGLMVPQSEVLWLAALAVQLVVKLVVKLVVELDGMLVDLLDKLVIDFFAVFWNFVATILDWGQAEIHDVALVVAFE
jgi:hypothetical protein